LDVDKSELDKRIKPHHRHGHVLSQPAKRLSPIAGYRASTRLVKYLSEGRDMEIALAPVAGTRLLAPFRMSVMSGLANFVIEASRFEATAAPRETQTGADPKAR
jgi:hypothetical protein